MSAHNNDQTNHSAEAIASMQDAYLTLLNEVGETPERDGLKDTPLRAAKALHFLTQGYRMDIDEVINGALFESENDEMVIVKDIELYSMCEHHMLPFIGNATSPICQRARSLAYLKLRALWMCSRDDFRFKKISPMKLLPALLKKLAQREQQSSSKPNTCV